MIDKGKAQAVFREKSTIEGFIDLAFQEKIIDGETAWKIFSFLIMLGGVK